MAIFLNPKINLFSNKSPELPEKLRLGQNPGSGTRYTCILSAYKISAKNMQRFMRILIFRKTHILAIYGLQTAEYSTK